MLNWRVVACVSGLLASCSNDESTGGNPDGGGAAGSPGNVGGAAGSPGDVGGAAGSPGDVGGAAGSATGAAGAAGAPGSAGAAGEPAIVAGGEGDADELLIGDFDAETGSLVSVDDTTTYEVGNPDGAAFDAPSIFWGVFGDGSGTISGEVVDVSDTPIDGNARAVHVTGTDFSVWGAGLGVVMQALADEPLVGEPSACFWDMSAYAGIRFWARAASEDTVVRMKFPTAATWDRERGGACETQCSDDYGASITLTPEWQEFTIPFADLGQEGWGSRQAWAPELGGIIQWVVSNAVASSFEFYVDEVEFIAP